VTTEETLFWAVTRIQLCLDDLNEGMNDATVQDRLRAVHVTLTELRDKVRVGDAMEGKS
jgi:hypothetical protein